MLLGFSEAVPSGRLPPPPPPTSSGTAITGAGFLLLGWAPGRPPMVAQLHPLTNSLAPPLWQCLHSLTQHPSTGPQRCLGKTSAPYAASSASYTVKYSGCGNVGWYSTPRPTGDPPGAPVPSLRASLTCHTLTCNDKPVTASENGKKKNRQICKLSRYVKASRTSVQSSNKINSTYGAFNLNS